MSSTEELQLQPNGNESKNTFEDEDFYRKRNISPTLRTVWAIASVATIVIAVVLLMTAIPFKYVIEGPGPTFDVLGEVNDAPVISLAPKTGQPALPATPSSEGQLRAVTVSISGGPGRMVNLMMLLNAWWQGDNILPEEQVYPQGITAEQVQQVSTQQMKSSQFNAEVAALEELGYEVPATSKVVDFSDWSDAKGKLEAGDVIREISLDGTDKKTVVNRPTSSQDFVAGCKVGDTVTITFDRSGITHQAQVKLAQNPETKKPAIGVFLDVSAQFPIDIKVQLGDTGGPSAGVMFALGIMDKLTPGDLTGGKKIAGTGALSLGGEVTVIGGADQKIRGAARDGANWFLLPEENCGELKEVPAGITPVPIKTLAQARSVVEDIATDHTQDLPKCPAR